MDKVNGVTVGTIIAFIAPGFIAVHAVGVHYQPVRTWLASAASSEQSLGVFLFVLLGSLSLGVVVSGVRALVVDRMFASRLPIIGRLEVPSVDHAKLADERVLGAFAGIVENYFVLTALALVLSARDSLNRYGKATQRLFNPGARHDERLAVSSGTHESGS